MKISVGMNLQEGPFGGGNQFGQSLVRDLRRRGVEVVFDLNHPDLDIILLAEPRGHLRISAYTDREIFRHLSGTNSRAIVVHRVNECDERKGTRVVNRRLRRANLCVDHTVFVSAWLRDLHLAHGWPCSSTSVILNGSDTSLFHPNGYIPWDGEEPLRLVTHHWGASRLKGFDVYERLDELLGEEDLQGQFEFTYVGQLPQDVRFRHTRLVEPLSGSSLADEIRSHHVYLTASQNEPGSNHQNEGALCGLPLLYRENASMPEYCQGFGISFTPETFVQSLLRMRETYDQWVVKMPEYPHTAERMCRDWFTLLQRLLDRRAELHSNRQPHRHLRWQIQRAMHRFT